MSRETSDFRYNTFIATVAYPRSVGAKLVFADVDPGAVNTDPRRVGAGGASC